MGADPERGLHDGARAPPPLVLSNAERSAALAAFKTLARQVAGDGVTINTVLPGRIRTDRLISARRLGGDGRRRGPWRRSPPGAPATSRRSRAVAAFLCSDRASYVTGVALAVDEGLLRAI